MKICIDAGHNGSGFDTGAIGVGGLLEQNVTFQIAKDLERILNQSGIETVMTRKSEEENLGTDVPSSLRERVRLCNENRCDFFVSIHCNSGVPSANGTEVLIPARGGEAERVAELVIDSICSRLNMSRRGVRVDTQYLGSKIYVLHNTDCPAILIETGFITNPEEAKKLSENAEEFALAIASAFGAGGGKVAKFTDIEGHWAQIHIEKLADYGIVNGFEDGSFRPDEPITRAAAAVMVSNALSVLGK